MTPRQWWKITWRAIRVYHREQAKATTDMMLYGTGVVKIPDDGSDPCHIPIEDVTFELPPVKGVYYHKGARIFPPGTKVHT